MRILQVGKYYPPFQGGMETVLENLVLGLMESDQDVAVLVAGQVPRLRKEFIDHQGRRTPLWRLANLGIFNSQPLTPGLVSGLRRAIAVFHPDLIHLHLPNPLLVAAWRLLEALPGKEPLPPLVVWHHADITRQRWGRRLLGPSVRRLLTDAAGITISSRALLEASADLAPHAHKIQVVPFGIEPEPWVGVTPDFSGSFLFVGRLVAYKGLETLVEAVSLQPDLSVNLVGEGPLRGRLVELIRSLGLANRVHLLGSLSRDDLLAVMAQARGLILPSLDTSETFGLVQLEAMAAGLPVVVSDLPTGVREVGVPDKTCLLTAPGHPDQLAVAMSRLQSDRELCRLLGNSGRQRFLEGFTRRAMMTTLLDGYQALLCQGPSPGGTP